MRPLGEVTPIGRVGRFAALPKRLQRARLSDICNYEIGVYLTMVAEHHVSAHVDPGRRLQPVNEHRFINFTAVAMTECRNESPVIAQESENVL